jgi:hypothetical protein
MAYEINDFRSREQKKWMTTLVMGMDTFLSGWGKAANGASIAAWACSDDTAELVREWVEGRGDIVDVTVGSMEDVPDCEHLSIYPVTQNHPSMRGVL